jgi:nucleotide-binding universal stress UspA family protein
MNQERTLSIRRILVALDASPHSLAALETAAELAAGLHAELRGLFVEDINLIRLAQLPFAREVSYFSTEFRRVELHQLEQQLRAQANRLRDIMAAVADRANIPWELRIVRGSVASEVLTAAADTDLIVMGKLGRSLAGRMGSTTKLLVMHGRGLTMIMQQDYRLTLPVIVIYDGSMLAKKALEAAIHLAKTRDGRLRIFILAKDKDVAIDLQADTRERPFKNLYSRKG